MAEALAGLGAGAGIGLGLGVLSDQARLGILYAKWHGRGRTWKCDRIAEALQSILNAEKDSVTGMSSKGTVDTVVDFIDATINFAVQVDESIATQTFLQMLHQSIAYAIHASHAGSIGTIGNVYSGGMYLSGAESSGIGEEAEHLSRGLRAFLSAEVGQNLPTLAFNLVRGANRRLEDSLRGILSQVDTFVSEWNDLSLAYYRQYHTLAMTRFTDAIKMKENVTDRAYSLLEQMANEHLARINEQLDTLEGGKNWFDAELMSSEELGDVGLRIGLEVEASEDDWESHKTAILKAIDDAMIEWDLKVNQALDDLTDSEYRYCILIRQMLDEVFTDVIQFVSQLVGYCESAVADVCAYRNIEQPVNINVQDPLTHIETASEYDVSRMYYQKWTQASASIVVLAMTRVNGVHWEGALFEPEVAIEEPDYSQLEIKEFVQVVPDIIVGEYTLVTFLSWVSLT